MQRARLEPVRRPLVESKAATLFIAAVPALIFICIVGWFRSVGMYERHFFDSGAPVILYNAFRVGFALLFAWMVYALGYALLAICRVGYEQGLSPAERAVFGFAVGIGALHAIMLVLGIAGLYYEWLMIALSLALLCATGLHFEQIVRAAATYRFGRSPVFIATLVMLAVAAFWLLSVKGLYPGGGGDYYTHYFYYYLAVLHSHGLAPNDVWYHFYYSKGAGPTFLAMLLTDPESTEIVTYCCVLFAAVAAATLSARLLPRSFWPALCAGLYLLAYIVPLGPADGGEFQKPHEETSALVVFVAWAICMRQIGSVRWRKLCLVAAAAALVAGAIVELAAAIILAVVFGILAVGALLRRKRPDFVDFGSLAMVAGGSAIAMLLLNYAVTGLATDQGLDVMLRFANLERLDAWGVIPQIVIVEWIRDNYAALAPPFGFGTILQLRAYLRLDYLWLLIESAVIALCISAWRKSAGNSGTRSGQTGGLRPPGINAWGDSVLVRTVWASNISEVAVLTLVLVAVVSFIGSIQEVRDAGIADAPWMLLGGSLVALYALSARANGPRAQPRRSMAPSDSSKAVRFLGAFIGLLAIISVPAAGSQTVSYLRFCGFFVPLIVLFCGATWGMLAEQMQGVWRRGVCTIVPAVLIVAVLGTWQVSNIWFNRALAQTRHAVRFSIGKYSLANAYSHQSSGLTYGGINPAVLEAVRHTPAGSRVWSTDVDSYCMAPGCTIESSVSFKLSSHLNEILNGPPAAARHILQTEGLNYFLFSKDAPNGIIDLLPFSRLFNPQNMDRNLGIKWTDGTEYLLTWRGPGVAPMSEQFRMQYASRLAGTEHPWFRFRELVAQMNTTITRLHAEPHPWRRLDFAWRRSGSEAQAVSRERTSVER